MSEFFITEKCVHCGACQSDCPAQAIKNFSIDEKKCIECGDCYEICPVGAIEKKSILEFYQATAKLSPEFVQDPPHVE